MGKSADIVVISKPFRKRQLGIVCEFNKVKLVVVLGKNIRVVPYYTIESNVDGLYRSSMYNNNYAAYDLQDAAMALIGNRDIVAALSKTVKNDLSKVLVYILTSGKIRYPSSFATFEFTIEELLDESNSFQRVL